MSTVLYTQKKLPNTVYSFLKKSFFFVKESLLISFIFATLLYILMRLFFIGAEFDTAETIELYVKTFAITCFYINVFRVICKSLIWLEVKSSKATFKGVFNMQLAKRAAIVIVVAGLATFKTTANPSHTIDTCTITKVEKTSDYEVVPQLYLWMK